MYASFFLLLTHYYYIGPIRKESWTKTIYMNQRTLGIFFCGIMKQNLIFLANWLGLEDEKWMKKRNMLKAKRHAPNQVSHSPVHLSGPRGHRLPGHLGLLSEKTTHRTISQPIRLTGNMILYIKEHNLIISKDLDLFITYLLHSNIGFLLSLRLRKNDPIL